MKTRTRILEKALALYNAHGLYNRHGQQVTARSIAEAAGISDGNLRYHFRTQEDIVYALYLQLVDTLNAGLTQPSADLQALYHQLGHTYDCLYAYRFLMQDFVGIMRHIPSIRDHFQALQVKRRDDFVVFSRALVKKGVLTPEPYPGAFAAFMTRFQILSDFWMASAELLYTGEPAAMAQHYLRINFQAIYPYLSPAGRAEFHSILGV